MADKKKMGFVVLGIAILVIAGVVVRDVLRESGRRFDVSPLSPETRRYDCNDGRFLLLYFFTENDGRGYVEAAFDDIQQATLVKAEVGGRYTDGGNLLELFETDAGWQVYRQGERLFADCRLVSR